MADQAIKRAALECRLYKSTEVNTVHLLLGILYKTEDPTTSILESYDIDYQAVSKHYKSMLKENGDLPKNQAFDDDEDKDDAFSQMKKPSGNLGTGKSKTPVLDNFGRDLTGLARDGKLDPVIGREKRLREYHKFFPEERKTILF